VRREHIKKWPLLPLMAVLAAGCAGTMAHGSGTGGSGSHEGTEPQQEEARQAEVETTLGHLWNMANGVNQVGTQLSFTFWMQNGALTLLEHRREQEGRQEGRGEAEETFARKLRPLLAEYLRGRTGEVVLTLRREQAGWEIDSKATNQTPRPPEAKTQPVNQLGASVNTQAESFTLASRISNLLPVPSKGTASLRVEVTLEDDRVTGWEHHGYEVTHRGGKPRPVSEESVERLAKVLLPFTHGVGRRTLYLELHGTHEERLPAAHMVVTVARTRSPAPLPEVDPDFAAQYRAMHEDILRRWREGVHEGAELLARYTLEEVALWHVGGILTRRMGLIFETVAPTVTRALTRGGTEAAGWLRTTLRRLPQAERAAFDRLRMKVQMEGAEALSRAERAEFLTLMNQLERLIKLPLEATGARRLRRAARESFVKLNPKLDELMRRKGPYEVHHRYSLEHAHLFPEMDINARTNLTALGGEVHQSINSIWTEFRLARSNAKADEVKKVVDIIDRHFSRWYDTPHAPGESARALAEATKAARKEVERLLSVK
jgi:hypothetical protein